MKFISIILLVTLNFISTAAIPCTTLFLAGNTNKVVGKNLDWPFGQGMAVVNKRHVHKEAVFVDPSHALSWTSKYMSVTFTQSGREFPWEGMNEAGVSVTIMQLLTTQPPVDARPAVNGLQWIQFILDTSGSLTEAIYNAQSVRIGGQFALSDHYVVCDTTSQCAVFENLNGQLEIHSGSTLPYKALTNNTYADSVNYVQTLLAKEDPKTIINTPGEDSLDRFARAALLSQYFQSSADPISYAFSALDNVRQAQLTKWNLVFDLSTRQIYFRTFNAPKIKLVDLKALDPRCVAPVKIFNMNAPLSGDITGQFLNYDAAANRRLVEMSTVIGPAAKVAIESFPETKTKCLE